MNPPLSDSISTPDFNPNDGSVLNHSTLSQASNNEIKGSEFNNVRHDMFKVVINNNLPDLQVTPNSDDKKDRENNQSSTTVKSGRRRTQFLRRFLNISQSLGVSHDAKHLERSPKETRIATTSRSIGGASAEVTCLSHPDIGVLSTVNTLNNSTCTVSPINSRTSIPRTYSRLMLVHELGYPLYMPEPDLGLRKEYRKKGVRIGDVGRITPSGSFDFLFNICYPANHPINPGVLPDGFEVLQPFDISVGNNFGPKTFLLSEHVTQTNTLLITYQCSGPEGAVLALPDGATLFEAQNMGEFQNQAARHAESWYKYMNGYKGRGASNGSLYLVTGCIKSRNWGIGSFYRGETAGNRLQFVPNDTSGCSQSPHPTYRWETSGKIIARMGPNTQNTAGTDDEELNQCTFLSGYKIRLQDDVWESLANGITVPSPKTPFPEPQSNKEWNGVSSKGSSATQKSGNHSTSLSGGSDSGSTWSRSTFELAEEDLITEPLVRNLHVVHARTELPDVKIHPSDFINIMLLESEPNARLAIAHDKVWCNALPKQFAVDPSNLKIDELLKNVSGSYVGMMDEFGCTSLVISTHMADMERNLSSTMFDANQSTFALNNQVDDSVWEPWGDFGKGDADAMSGIEWDLNGAENHSSSSSPQSTEDLLDIDISHDQPMQGTQDLYPAAGLVALPRQQVATSKFDALNVARTADMERDPKPRTCRAELSVDSVQTFDTYQSSPLDDLPSYSAWESTKAVTIPNVPMATVVWIHSIMALLRPWSSESRAVWVELLGYRINHAYICKNGTMSEDEFVIIDLSQAGQKDPLLLCLGRAAGERKIPRPSPSTTTILSYSSGLKNPSSPPSLDSSPPPTSTSLMNDGIASVAGSSGRAVRRFTDPPLSRPSGISSNKYLATDTVEKLDGFPKSATIVRTIKFNSNDPSKRPSLWDLMVLTYALHVDSLTYEVFEKECFRSVDTISAILEKWSETSDVAIPNFGRSIGLLKWESGGGSN